MKVLKIGEEKRKLKSQAETAAEFLKSRLYGAHIPRESSKSFRNVIVPNKNGSLHGSRCSFLPWLCIFVVLVRITPSLWS